MARKGKIHDVFCNPAKTTRSLAVLGNTVDHDLQLCHL